MYVPYRPIGNQSQISSKRKKRLRLYSLEAKDMGNIWEGKEKKRIWPLFYLINKTNKQIHPLKSKSDKIAPIISKTRYPNRLCTGSSEVYCAQAYAPHVYM